ncbi:MAG: DUF2029 domain-containing protein [Candidatus Omnitrophica bacterium]|nr:DUF2029 domain-containing protein [Candidatus Omnitrophota bacterium]
MVLTRLRDALRSPAVWLIGLGVVCLIRFPVKFALEPPFLMDFEVYRFIGERVLTGDTAHLYAPTTSERMVFKYAPCWAILFAPLGALSSHAGGVLWSALNVLWLTLTGWLADRLCRLLSLRPAPWLAIAAVVLLVRPITAEFLLGQADLLWGVLIAAFLYAEASGRRWLAALWLALAVSLKLPALLFLIYAGCRRRWAPIGRTLVCLAALNLSAAWLLLPAQPLGLFRAWFGALATSGTTYAFDISNQSLLALAGRLLRQDGYGLNVAVLSDATVMLLTAIAQLLAFAALVRPARPALPDRVRLILDGALLTVFVVLFSPSGWLATYTVLLSPVALALALLLARPALTWRTPGLAFPAAALFLLSALTHAKFWRLAGIPHWRGESYVYLVLMILPWLGVCLAWYLWGHRRRAAGWLA